MLSLSNTHTFTNTHKYTLSHTYTLSGPLSLVQGDLDPGFCSLTIDQVSDLNPTLTFDPGLMTRVLMVGHRAHTPRVWDVRVEQSINMTFDLLEFTMIVILIYH